MPTATFPTGYVFQDTYRVGGVLGEGGMGVVYEVTHLRMGRRFALKVLSANCSPDPDVVARFRREAEVTGHMDHPNIVSVVDFNLTPDGTHFLVMELLEGETLDRVVRREGPLDLGRVAAIVAQVASALEAAHRKGVVHRDLKPENIMLCRQDGREVAKVLDFGLSKLLATHTALTRSGVTFGTPQFMSPEQALEASAVDARSDIFSLGAIVYDMLAGKPPFEGTAVPSILYKVVHEAPESLLRMRPDLPAAVVEAVERALRKRPEERFGSATELADAFSGAEVTSAIRKSASRVALEEVATDPSGLGIGTSSVREPTSSEGSPAQTDPSPLPTPYDESAVGEVGRTLEPSPADGTASAAPPPSSWRWIVPLVAAAVGLSAGGTWLALRRGESPRPAASNPRARGLDGAPRATPARPALTPDASSHGATRDAALGRGDLRAPSRVAPAIPGPGSQPRTNPHHRVGSAKDRRPDTATTRGPEARTALLSVSVGDENDYPLSATVLVEGRPYRCCPLEGLPQLAVGRTYRIEVRCDGYASERGRIQIQEGENRKHFTLYPLARTVPP
jgi:serine/threonine-protein kinase